MHAFLLNTLYVIVFVKIFLTNLNVLLLPLNVCFSYVVWFYFVTPMSYKSVDSIPLVFSRSVKGISERCTCFGVSFCILVFSVLLSPVIAIMALPGARCSPGPTRL